MPVLDRKVIFFLHFYTPNAKFKTHSVIFIVLVRPTYFVFPLQSSIVFSECNNFPLKYQIVFNECVKYNKSFHLAKVTGKMRILSSSVFNSVPQHLRKVERLQWRSNYRLGCMCLRLFSVLWQWCPGLPVNCAVMSECAPVGDIPRVPLWPWQLMAFVS